VFQCVTVCCSAADVGDSARNVGATGMCVAVCCSVLQCVAVCCRVLQGVAGCCRALQCVAVRQISEIAHDTSVRQVCVLQ